MTLNAYDLGLGLQFIELEKIVGVRRSCSGVLGTGKASESHCYALPDLI